MGKKLFILALSILTFARCSDGNTLRISPLEISGLENEYTLLVGLIQVITSNDETVYLWELDNNVVTTALKYSFISTTEGIHRLKFTTKNDGSESTKEIVLTVISEDQLPIAIPQIYETEIYTISPLEIPDYLSDEEQLSWKVLRAPTELYRLSYSNADQPLFVAAHEGEYSLQVSGGEIKGEITINVKKNSRESSVYISKVFDHKPAPGQFVNKLPEYQEGDTYAGMARKANDCSMRNIRDIFQKENITPNYRWINFHKKYIIIHINAVTQTTTTLHRLTQ